LDCSIWRSRGSRSSAEDSLIRSPRSLICQSSRLTAAESCDANVTVIHWHADTLKNGLSVGRSFCEERRGEEVARLPAAHCLPQAKHPLVAAPHKPVEHLPQEDPHPLGNVRFGKEAPHVVINVDLPWNPANLEQRKGRIDRIGPLASSIDILNLRYRGSVEDQVHHVLSSRLQEIREIFGTIPDTIEDVWVAVANGEIEEARRRIDEVPSRHPFELGYAADLPETAWERCAQVLDRYDVQRMLRKGR